MSDDVWLSNNDRKKAIFVAIKEHKKKLKYTTTKIPRQVINANEQRQSCESYLSSFAFSFLLKNFYEKKRIKNSDL